MVLTPLQRGIVEFCFEKFKNRQGRVCFIHWLPDEWSKVDIHIALEEMLHQGIISLSPYGNNVVEDGFILNMP